MLAEKDFMKDEWWANSWSSVGWPRDQPWAAHTAWRTGLWTLVRPLAGAQFIRSVAVQDLLRGPVRGHFGLIGPENLLPVDNRLSSAGGHRSTCDTVVCGRPIIFSHFTEKFIWVYEGCSLLCRVWGQRSAAPGNRFQKGAWLLGVLACELLLISQTYWVKTCRGKTIEL